MSKKKIGLFVDAENVSHAHLHTVVKELSKRGDIIIARAFADWSMACVQKWSNVLVNFGVIPVHQFSNAKGKNASDIALSISLVDSLQSLDLDTVCIMTSDGDFAPLVAHCRSKGVYVIGAGENKSPAQYRNLCNDFLALSIEKKPACEPVAELREIVLRETANLRKSNTVVNLGTLSQALLKRNVRYKDLGYQSFKQLVASLNLFQIGRDGLLTRRKLVTPKKNIASDSSHRLCL